MSCDQDTLAPRPLPDDVNEIVEFELGYGVGPSGTIYTRRQIGNFGRPRDFWTPIKPQKCAKGRYMQVGISGRRKVLVHCVVAAAFLGPCPDGMEVSHKNGNSHENRASNLCYETPVQNNQRKREHGTNGTGSKNNQAKLSEDDVVFIRAELSKGIRGTQRKLARQFGVCEATISFIKSGGRWGK